LVLESPAVVQLDGGLDRSREIGGSVVSAMEGNYQGAVDPCEHDDVKAERVRVGLWQTGSALDTLFYGPWEKRTSDKPESHPRASMKPDVTTHHSGS